MLMISLLDAMDTFMMSLNNAYVSFHLRNDFNSESAWIWIWFQSRMVSITRAGSRAVGGRHEGILV
jgi:hypothetical protein